MKKLDLLQARAELAALIADLSDEQLTVQYAKPWSVETKEAIGQEILFRNRFAPRKAPKQARRKDG